MRKADKDILCLLAALEFEANYASDDEEADPSDVESAARNVTTLRRVVREAGYEIPSDFDWERVFDETY